MMNKKNSCNKTDILEDNEEKFLECRTVNDTTETHHGLNKELNDDSIQNAALSYEIDSPVSECDSPDPGRRDFQIPFLRDVYSFLVDSVESGANGCKTVTNPVDGRKTYMIDVSLDVDDESQQESSPADEFSDPRIENSKNTVKHPFPLEVEAILSHPSHGDSDIKIKLDRSSPNPGGVKSFRSHYVPPQSITAGIQYYATNISAVNQALAAIQCLITSFTSHQGAERVAYKIHENLITNKKTLFYTIEEILYHSSETESCMFHSSKCAKRLCISGEDDETEIIKYEGTTLPIFSCVICHAVDSVVDEIITISTKINSDGNKVASCIIERTVDSIFEGHEQSIKFNTVISQQSSKVMNNLPVYEEFSGIKLHEGYQVPFYSNVLVYLSRSILSGSAIYTKMQNPFTGELLTVYSIAKSPSASQAFRLLDILQSEDFLARLDEMKNFRAAHYNESDADDDLEDEAIALSCSFLSCFRYLFS